MERFCWPSLKEYLDILDSWCQFICRFSVPVMMCPLWTKSPQQDSAGLSAPGRPDTLLSLQKQLAAKSAFVLNGRKQAFMDPTLGLGGTEPPAVKWHTTARGREWQRGLHICLVPLAICFLLWSTLSPAPPPLLFIHIIMPVYLFAPKLMGSCLKDGPVATFCFLCHHPTN